MADKEYMEHLWARGEVGVLSPWRELRTGRVRLSPDRTKKTVGVYFDPPLALGWPTMGQVSGGHEEFDLATGQRLVWGQGDSTPVNDWTLDETSRLAILAGGGG